jgi:hypothetical protein
VEVVEGAAVRSISPETTTMIIVGIVLGFVGLGFLCSLLFTLAVHALPFFAGTTAGFAAYHSGAGEIGAILVGLIAGALTLAAGQIAVAAFRLPLIRTAIARLRRAGRGSGHHAALGLAQIGVPAEVSFALIGAITVGRHGMGAHGTVDPVRCWAGRWRRIQISALRGVRGQG